MASGFDELYDKDGFVIKARARFGKMKELTINTFNGKSYIHINDNSKCVPNGKFDYTKSKSVTLNMEEALLLPDMIRQAQAYDTAFEQRAAVTQQQHPQQQPHTQHPQQQPPPLTQQQQQQQQQQQHPQQQYQDAFVNWYWEDNSNLIAIPLQSEGYLIASYGVEVDFTSNLEDSLQEFNNKSVVERRNHVLFFLSFNCQEHHVPVYAGKVPMILGKY